MVEYIEREAVLAELQEEMDCETPMYTAEQNKYFNIGLKCAYRDVKRQPAADVVEVRHGEWVDTETFDSHYTPNYQCSECGKEVADNYISCHKYCLHCGAKMDGKGENND